MAYEATLHDDLYEQVKDMLLEGRFGRDVRIDLQQLAERYRVSTTPVREVLYQLLGERLVAQHPAGGFKSLVPDARSLHDLYAWNGLHVGAAVHLLPDPVLRQVLRPIAAAMRDDPTSLTERLFEAVAHATGNQELAIEVRRANERLRRPRLAEERLFADRTRELASIVKVNGFDVRNNVRRRIAAYHRRRAELAAQIAALIN